VKYANINTASTPMLVDRWKGDPTSIHTDIQAKLIPEPPLSQEYQRLLTRTWTALKTGK